MAELKSVILRHASDDFDVLMVASAMVQVGAEPFAVFPTGHKGVTAFAVMSRYCDSEISIKEIDEAIELARFGEITQLQEESNAEQPDEACQQEPDPYSYLYLMAERKYWHYDVPDDWEETHWERFDYVECGIYRKLTADLNDVDRKWLSWHGCEPEGWIPPSALPAHPAGTKPPASFVQ